MRCLLQNKLQLAVVSRRLISKTSSLSASANASSSSSSSSSSLSSSGDEPNTAALFTQEHRSLRESLRKLIDAHINPFVDEWEATCSFPAHKVFKVLGSAGFLGVNKDTKDGGLGLDFSYSMALAEELGSIRCGAIPMAIGVQTDMATPALSRFGSEKLKRNFLTPSIKGDMVACLGVSEASAGSDVANIATRAEVRGEELVINGSKMWITNGHQADWMCLLANTNSSATSIHSNKSLICVPMDAKGVSLGQPIRKLGMRSSDTAQVFFEDVRLPIDYVIGQMGKGFQYQMMQFQEERMFGVAVSLLALENCIRETAEYAAQRKIYGHALLNQQVVHFRLAELQTELEALRAMLYRAVALYVFERRDVTLLASMAKLKAGRLAREITDSCLQFWGGMGFTESAAVSRLYRDMRLLSIGAGADEVMLSIISKFMGTYPEQKVGKLSKQLD